MTQTTPDALTVVITQMRDKARADLLQQVQEDDLNDSLLVPDCSKFDFHAIYEIEIVLPRECLKLTDGPSFVSIATFQVRFVSVRDFSGTRIERFAKLVWGSMSNNDELVEFNIRRVSPGLSGNPLPCCVILPRARPDGFTVLAHPAPFNPT